MIRFYTSPSCLLRSNTRGLKPTYRRNSMIATRNPLPATFLRGGTSKGIFINRSHLPADESLWPPIFLGLMGSPDPIHARQLNGMGGGISSLSKICIVGPPAPAHEADGAHAEYTFAQIGIKDSVIDYSGNCGNLSSMIGVFAVDEGICSVPNATTLGPVETQTHTTIRAYNTNTKKLVETTFPIAISPLSVDSNRPEMVPALDLPEASIAGVPGLASQIMLDFLRPAGARTGRLLPCGINSTLSVPHPTREGQTTNVPVDLIDATNPTVFIDFSTFLAEFMPEEWYRSPEKAHLNLLEHIRQGGASAMGLDLKTQAQPKIAVLSVPEGEQDAKDGVDVVVHALSMGALHKAVPVTVGLALGVAAGVQGTRVWGMVREARRDGGRPEEREGGLVRIRHPGGLMDVGAVFGPNGDPLSARVVRTGRRLMKGEVWW